MSEFIMNDEGELVDDSGNVVADETAVSIANILVASLRKYESDRDLFMADREARKTNGVSNKVLLEKMGRIELSSEVRKAYDELIGDFVERFAELQDQSAGVLSLLFNDCQKGGRIFDYLVGEATVVAQSLTLAVDVIPTIEDLQKRAAKVRGLWTSLSASVESIEAIKALGVPCETTNKGRGDGTTWVVSMKELPKIKNTSDAVTEFAVLKMNGTEIWRSGTDVQISHAVSLQKIKWTEFERKMQLSEKIDPEGNKIEKTQQDIWSINLVFGDKHFTSEKVSVEKS